jgi:predicted CoA-binding protein
MISRAAIDEFLAQRRIAVVGVSRGGKKFGNTVLRDLAAKGYEVHAVNPNAETIDGQKCHPSLASLAGEVDAAVLVVPPSETEKVVLEAAEAGIRHLWLQPGAESSAAIRAAEERELDVIHHECILMYAEPAAWIHRTHRWLRGTFGRLPR